MGLASLMNNVTDVLCNSHASLRSFTAVAPSFTMSWPSCIDFNLGFYVDFCCYSVCVCLSVSAQIQEKGNMVSRPCLIHFLFLVYFFHWVIYLFIFSYQPKPYPVCYGLCITSNKEMIV